LISSLKLQSNKKSNKVKGEKTTKNTEKMYDFKSFKKDCQQIYICQLIKKAVLHEMEFTEWEDLQNSKYGSYFSQEALADWNSTFKPSKDFPVPDKFKKW
jgi:hypothetical protein